MEYCCNNLSYFRVLCFEAACYARPKLCASLSRIIRYRKTGFTGSLYNDGKAVVGGISDSWFGRRKNFKVGDIVVVVLDERAQASRTQNTTVERRDRKRCCSGLSWKNPNNKK